MRAPLRPAEKIGDSYVITTARWPQRDVSSFGWDRYVFQLQLRAEMAAGLRLTSFVHVSGVA